MKHIKLFENFLNEWKNKDVYDDPYLYKHAETIHGIYNGFNYHQMQKFMFDVSQVMMTIVAIDKLANTKKSNRYTDLSVDGMKLMDELKELAEIVGAWENDCGESYASKSNHYKNMRITFNEIGKKMTKHDELVIKDIPSDLRVTFSSLVDILKFFRDADLEKNFGDDEVTPEKLDLKKLDEIIQHVRSFLEKLKKSDLNK